MAHEVFVIFDWCHRRPRTCGKLIQMRTMMLPLSPWIIRAIMEEEGTCGKHMWGRILGGSFHATKWTPEAQWCEIWHLVCGRNGTSELRLQIASATVFFLHNRSGLGSAKSCILRLLLIDNNWRLMSADEQPTTKNNRLRRTSMLMPRKPETVKSVDWATSAQQAQHRSN